MLKKDGSFMDILTMIELSSNATYGSPYVLLAYSLLGTLGKTHSINRFLKARAEFAAKRREAMGGDGEGEGEGDDEEDME